MVKDRKSKIIELLSNDPGSSFLLFALAKEYEYEGDHLSAINTYQKLLTSDPDYTGAYYHLSKQFMAVNALTESVQTIRQGITVCKRLKATHDAAELNGLLEEINEEE